MLRYFLLLSFFFILTACASSSALPSSQGMPNTPKMDVTSIPTQFTLGQCVDARQPTPDPNQPSLFPKAFEQDHIYGASNASVTVLVYSDFQCTTCANLALQLKAIIDKNPKDVRMVFRNFPLISIHDKAAFAAQAAEAAGLQGKFWVMHDFLFSNQDQWNRQKPQDFEKWIIQQSSTLGLDPVRFETDFQNPNTVSAVQKAWTDGQNINLPGAPIILINGEIIKWQVNLLDQLEALIKLAMLPKKQFSNCPTVVINPGKQYSAVLKTSRGNITIKLFTDKSPNTVNNFVFLAKKGWFDHNAFIQSIPGFEVSTGDPSGTGYGGPGYFNADEKNNLQFDRSGMVAMKNAGVDTNGSIFFITSAPDSKINSKYTIFGEVTSGLDIVSQLASIGSHSQKTAAPIEWLNTVEIDEK